MCERARESAWEAEGGPNANRGDEGAFAVCGRRIFLDTLGTSFWGMGAGVVISSAEAALGFEVPREMARARMRLWKTGGMRGGGG